MMKRIPGTFILCRQHLSWLQVQHRLLCSGGAEATTTNIDGEVPRVYDLVNAERKALKKWKKLDRKASSQGSVFRMLLPPPNVTGKLHLGHFLTLSVEDTIARWKLMTGVDVEWIPGFDHAGIATQSIVNRKIAKKADPESSEIGQSLVNFASSSLQSIKGQLEKTGALLDWDKMYYTLDEEHSSVVKEAFLQLFESGLIKRADGIVNWSCALQTSIADIEVDEVDFEKNIKISVPNYKYPVEFGILYFVEYPLADSDKKLIVATSRPETMFGDVALAVNPGDSRYAQYVNKQVVNPVNGNILPIIADPRVKPDFGSGVVKITPAHDKLDFAIGSTHQLNYASIFTPDGLLNENTGEYQGVPRFIARKKVLEILREKSAIVEEKPYSGSVKICSRSGDVIEYRIVPHWFLQTQFLTNKLIKSINDKSFIIVPDNYSRSLVHQLTEAQDWCLSRQIKWGHRIPAFYHADHPEKWVVARDLLSAVGKLEQAIGKKISNSNLVIQDPDVLDTWFSSALIPLAVSGWPESEEFKEITLMETGHDILFFWVWRMSILTLALVDRFPFRHVLLHGIVTDTYGKKMSKSKGNVIDPVHIIDGITYENLLKEAEDSLEAGELDANEYKLRKASLKQHLSKGFPICGNDALRLTLLSQDISDEQITLDLTYLDNCRRFTNKLWQALRFLKMQSSNINKDDVSGASSEVDLQTEPTEFACKWILSCLYDLNRTCENSLNQGQFHLYAEAVRKFFYQELCDVYIEIIKGEVKSGRDVTKLIKVMQYAFEIGTKLAHPLIPFVTEEIWSYLRMDKTGSLLELDFPSSKDLEHFHDPDLMDSMFKAMHLTREIRSVKQRSGWSLKSVPRVYLEGDKSVMLKVSELREYVAKLSGSEITFGRYPAAEKESFGSFLVDVAGNICRIHIPIADESVKSTHDAKLEKLKLKLLKLQSRYQNPSFQQNAPPEAKEKLKKRVETLLLHIQDSISDDSKTPNQPS